MTTGLDLSLRIRQGTFTLAATARVARGEVLGIIGANGSGKSTLLGAIAGSHRLDDGIVQLNDRVLSRRMNGDAGIAIHRPERRIGLLDQRALLFPHLDTRENIAFAPRALGVHRREADRIAESWLDRVGLPGRGDARPRDLSGGQQQRVAIARTLAAEPELLLLDEPFAALDVTSRSELRSIIAAEAQRLGIPIIIVSHDPLDLITLADRMMVLESGRVAQEGSVTSVLEFPATPFAAAFTGRALLRGTSGATGELRLETLPIDTLRGHGTLPEAGSAAVASFDPARVQLAPSTRPSSTTRDTSSNAPNTWHGTIEAVSSDPSGIRVGCAEWPEVWAMLPLSRAFERWLVPGASAVWQIPEDDLRFATPA